MLSCGNLFALIISPTQEEIRVANAWDMLSAATSRSLALEFVGLRIEAGIEQFLHVSGIDLQAASHGKQHLTNLPLLEDLQRS